jgi:predicted Rossmann fold nucleotide-binding protein DprA/Smf involved in DNA uptake
MTRDIRDVVRDEPLVRDRLLELLASEAMTIPELAAAAQLPGEEVMVWVMGMRKYGYVVEEKGSGRVFEYRYRRVGK